MGSQFGQPPKNATHLINFAKKNNVSLSWKEAKAVILKRLSNKEDNKNNSQKQGNVTIVRYENKKHNQMMSISNDFQSKEENYKTFQTDDDLSIFKNHGTVCTK